MRSVVAFIACTGFIVWAHSCDTRLVGVKTNANESTGPIYDQEFASPDLARVTPVLYAHNIRTVYLDTVSVHPESMLHY